MKEEMQARIEKVKTHFTNHKREYLIGMSCFVAGGVVAAALRRPQEVVKMTIGDTSGSANEPTMNYFRNYYAKTITKYGNDVGRPGKWVLNTRTNKLYKAEYLAAKDAGVSQATMSNHLLGKTRTILGDVYKFVDVDEV